MATDRCWEVRIDCDCRGVEPLQANCPPYRDNKSCWEYDWLGFFEKLPASEQEVWSGEFVKCLDCPVFPLFSAEMQTNIVLLKEQYHHD